MWEEIYFSDVGRNIEQRGQFFDPQRQQQQQTQHETVDYAAAIRQWLTTSSLSAISLIDAQHFYINLSCRWHNTLASGVASQLIIMLIKKFNVEALTVSSRKCKL